jgi:tetratricopeptide (TPR) repeat protein
MRRKTLIWCSLVVVALLASVATRPSSVGGSPAGPPSTAAIREQKIRFYQARVDRDPYGARDRAVLAALYLARGRASGHETDYARAESLARASWTTREKRNARAASVLVGALMARHRFTQAYVVMRRVVRLDPDDRVARATLGEIALELGRYPAADSLFLGLSLFRNQPAIAPQYARWLELSGRSGEARLLLQSVRDRLAGGFRVPPEQLAWFDLRIGELAARNGRADLAEAAYRRGLAEVPGDPRLLTALGLLREADQRWADAAALGEEALGSLFDPVTLGLLSESYAQLGDSLRAAEFARGAEVAVSRQPGAYHRLWALFLLDHRREVAEILRRARAELATRKDVYGYDVYAWALHRSGDDRLARVMADSALRRGTSDGLLHYHAGMIALALGDSTRTRAELRQALAINPRFHPIHAPAAGKLLRRLGDY